MITATDEKIKSAKNKKRFASFFVDGVPKKIHCYDNGGRSFDRYTIVFTGNYRHMTCGEFIGLGASEHPFHPQGFGQHFSHSQQCDYPTYGHLGKKVKYETLPHDVQKFILDDYLSLWGFTNDNGEWQ